MSDSPMVLHTRVVTRTGGGPEKTILNGPRLLIPFGYNVLCAYMHPPRDPGFEELRQKAEACGAPLVGIEDRGPWDLRVVWRLLRICREHRVVIWHGHDYKSNAIGLLLRRFWPMRLVSTVHGWVDRKARMPWYERIDKLCLRRYERVICVSEDLWETCIACGVAAERCVVIQNAIDTAQYTRRTSTRRAKQSLGLEPERLLIGAVGRLADEKNLVGLIRTVARLVDEGIDAELVIVGEGPQRGHLESLIAELGRQDRIHLLGYRADTIDLYQAMDVFALSSLREGFPNVLLEAMAMEVPVVATRVAGVPRLVQHGENGLLVDANNLEQLKGALKGLLADPDLRVRLAAAGRRTIEQSYSFEVRMAKVRAVYDQLLNDGKGSAEG